MLEPIDWAFAGTVARRICGSDSFRGSDSFSGSYHAESLIPDFSEFTAQAEDLVARETGLHSFVGPARARVATREEWVDANIRSFRRLFQPMSEKLGERMSGPLAPVARRLAGAEIGSLLGWMSKRVLGQYDLMIAPDDNPDEQDVVYYVGPNVLSLEKRFGFPPREFRLWLALHEVTHRAQFTGVPWMRGHYVDLINTTMSLADPDPKRFFHALKLAATDLRRGRNPLLDGGLPTLMAGPEQRAAIDAIGGLMSLLEGHGDVTMDRAGGPLVPSAERFSRVLSQRRADVRGMARLLRQLLGIEAKMRQYEQGEAFIVHVEGARGPRFLDMVWAAPGRLPTLVEIRDPGAWLTRMDRLALGTP